MEIIDFHYVVTLAGNLLYNYFYILSSPLHGYIISNLEAGKPFIYYTNSE